MTTRGFFAMSTKEMPSVRKVFGKLEDSLKFDGASQPDKSLYAHHIGFTMRTISKSIPPETIRLYSDYGPRLPIPRAFHLTQLPAEQLPLMLFESADKKTALKAMQFEKGQRGRRLLNTDGDEVWFIHKGQGVCKTILGMIDFKAPAYLFIPKSYLYQLCPSEKTFMVGIESSIPLRRPVFSWVNDTVPYVEHDLLIPNPAPCDDASDTISLEEPKYWHVDIKRIGVRTTIEYRRSPFSCVGYQGYPYPFVLPIEKISLPTLSKEHTDPTSFMTFASPPELGGGMPSLCVSTFLPHRMYSLPYFHTNFYDECLFLSRAYKARGGVLGRGDMSFHPQGFPHGPQPEALRAWKKPKGPKNLPYVPMLAVMFESQSPLIPTAALVNQKGIEVRAYRESWNQTVRKEETV